MEGAGVVNSDPDEDVLPQAETYTPAYQQRADDTSVLADLHAGATVYTTGAKALTCLN